MTQGVNACGSNALALLFQERPRTYPRGFKTPKVKAPRPDKSQDADEGMEPAAKKPCPAPKEGEEEDPTKVREETEKSPSFEEGTCVSYALVFRYRGNTRRWRRRF